MADREPVLRAILLGASNLRLALPVVLGDIRGRVAGPIDALVACGHGRSYGAWSRCFFVRRLPGIVRCGLWPALEGRPSLRTLALITDIGNDLVYGAEVEKLAAWVDTCLDRLARQRAEIVLTLLPMVRLEKLSPWEVRLATSILFPGRSAPWPELLQRARALDGRLRQMGRDYRARLVEPSADWYGIDPIHLRRRVRREAWRSVLSHWPDLRAADRPRSEQIRIPLLGAAEVGLLGTTLRRPQPAVRLADGTAVSLF